MKTYSFTHYGKISNSNQQTEKSRSHWAKSNESRKSEIESIIYSIKESGMEMIPAGLYDVVLVWHRPLTKGTCMDSDNLLPKSLLDALVRCGAEYGMVQNKKGEWSKSKVIRGILTDDNPKNIRNIHHFHSHSQSYHTVVTLVPHGHTLKWLLENGYDQF